MDLQGELQDLKEKYNKVEYERNELTKQLRQAEQRIAKLEPQLQITLKENSELQIKVGSLKSFRGRSFFLQGNYFEHLVVKSFQEIFFRVCLEFQNFLGQINGCKVWKKVPSFDKCSEWFTRTKIMTDPLLYLKYVLLNIISILRMLLICYYGRAPDFHSLHFGISGSAELNPREILQI